MSFFVELGHSVTLRIAYPVTEDRGHALLFRIGNGLTELYGEAVPVEDVIAQHQADRIVADE